MATTSPLQGEHPTLLVPGPVEFDDAVLQAMSHFSESHVGPAFVATFAATLGQLRQLLQTRDSRAQPFVLSGSGTLGWDQVAANLTEPGEHVLVLHCGYFADSFADCLATYGAEPTQLRPQRFGAAPRPDEVEHALLHHGRDYRVVTITHVDTSTGVRADVRAIADVVHRVKPDALVVVDAVCSLACEQLRFDDWHLDVVLSASQKAIGAPAGLSIVMASGRAIDRLRARKTRPSSYFASWTNWLPIMQNYEASKPSYFATPSPQLVHALHTALTQILAGDLQDRFAVHRDASRRAKDGVEALGLRQLASRPDEQANGMTAVWLPDGINGKDLVAALSRRGLVIAAGLHKDHATKYIRFGHMGVSVTQKNRNDVDKILKALKDALLELGYKPTQSS